MTKYYGKIICANCKKHLYNVKKNPIATNVAFINASNFVKANKKIPRLLEGKAFPFCIYCKTSPLHSDGHILLKVDDA